MRFKETRLGASRERAAVETPLSEIYSASNGINVEHNDALTTASYRGKSPAQLNFVYLGRDLTENPLIYNHIDLIFYEYFNGKSKSSLKTAKKNIRLAVRLIDTASQQLDLKIVSRDDFTPDVARLLIAYSGSDQSTYARLSTIRRFLTTIGVEKSLIPLNTKPQPVAKEKDAIPAAVLKSMIKHFKYEMDIVRARYDERLSMIAQLELSEPSLNKSERDLDDPLVRMYVLINKIGIEVKNVMQSRKNGLRTWMAAFETRPGAMCLQVSNQHRRVGGVTGHLAWFYPSQRDLLPFVMLLMIRTPFTYSQITSLSLGNYAFRSLAFEWSGKPNSVVQLAVPKYRVKQHVDDEPTMVKASTLVRPNSYAFQIIKFLEKLSEPLRKEAQRQIKNLKNAPESSAESSKLLERLEYVQNDLFIYEAEGTIRSLSEYDGAPSSFRSSLNLLGFPTDTKALRSTELASGVKLFGDDAAMATILGDHEGPDTYRHYINDREIRKRNEKIFIDIFEKSISLIDEGKYSIDNLRLILKNEGLSDTEVENILNKDFVTHWGNRCSNPRKPPEGFGKGTLPGKLCVEQNCIEGCARARWLPDAADILRQKIEQIRSRIASASFITIANSLLHEWLQRCVQLLAEIEKRNNGDERSR